MHLVVESSQDAVLKMLPYFMENAVLSQNEIYRILSESFFMVKGAALFLQQGSSPQCQKVHPHHKHAGDLPQHLQVMINLLRSEDRIKLAVRLESAWSDRVRYMVVVYTSGRQDTEENILLGMDFINKDSKSCSIGMVLPLWSDTKIHLDGDGGFSVNTAGRSHVFKPVSVQAMWSALQILHKACEVSRRYNYFPGGMALTWMGYYESCISSDQSSINEWNAMQDLETMRPDSPAMFVDKPTERERTECLIKAKLRSIMMFQDLENVTSKEIRNELEQHMNCNLKEYKEFIDNEMLLILGQMDKATLIFDHLYLGSEWNASNLEELQDSGVGYILNVTREIDNFFPGMFSYHNIRVYDDEATDLLAHWNDTYNFIVKAKKNHSKCLVHCKMGVSRSASTVIAYAMKEYGWSLEKAYNYVKQKRSITRPNAGFMRQLGEYEGILDASKQRHNKLWRPDSDSELPDGQQPPAQCGSADGPGELTPEPAEAWGGQEARPSPCRAIGVEVDPADPPNYNYYFRRLSDSALDSDPCTPVRAPPVLDMERVFIEIEDVERDALLDDEGFETRECPLPHFAMPGEGTAAQTCCRLEPLEADIRMKLEFGTVEEEDEEEEEEQEEADMVPLTAPGVGGGGGGGGGGSEGMLEEEKEEGGPLPCSSSLANRNRLNNENANNNNSLSSSKRSCPPGFDDSANTRNTYKIKPPYQACTDCMHSPKSQLCEPMVVERAHRLNPAQMCSITNICVQNSGSALAEHATISNMSPLSGLCRATSRRCSPSNCANSGISASAAHMEAYRHQQVSPMNCDELPRDQHREFEAESMNDLSEVEHRKGSGKTAKDLSLLKLSLEAERPIVPSYVMQHQESIMQLQKAGLVRKHTKELEKLSSLSLESPKPCSQLPEQMDTCSEEPDGIETVEDMEIDSHTLPEACHKTSTPCVGRLEGTESLPNDILKTVGGLTPVSSPHGSTLTRSSSTESLHSVRGKPGLVKQRTQEIETRLRLAGLTVSSKLKRSNSLAKLGSLTFSSEDLSSACSSSDTNTILFSTSAEASNAESWLVPGSHPVKATLIQGSWTKPLIGSSPGCPPQS
ncbi:protein phosphatase Slingshot homolog 1 isoform X2 [Lepisosteus oculatus]|uniref:protein phosphatase Slingshot homolog 1 isoform X2 n=1 Tax=Lepisosteus oculatus TaxID=7918 RepID=UPI00073FD4F4|nr:PREDICTED: protein phosphatase Slingshot homolog 1 isoform X2 [Lepisosteus oculatus]XP_015221812.1 PREDICTED: protein phosphatase Slingshot homolog 1 isoform X2 [Lepisosteus oculatus]XP_015221813.1 PREDICTED: protein phosphatase Slingshot homolog 1 isoform X2 [Lepisosteus oculatus]